MITAKKELPTGVDEFEEVIEFTEDFKWPGHGHTVTFDGDRFQQWIEDTLPMCKDMPTMSRSDAATDAHFIDEKFLFYLSPFKMWYLGSRYGSISYFGMPDLSDRIPIRNALNLHRGESLAACAFSTVINIPILAQRGRSSVDPWMSLTPNEVLTQRSQIRRAKKNTGMAGLGMGWSARKVLERKQVKHLTVYEKSQGLIDFFGPALLADYPDRVTIVRADAYKVDWMQHDVALWDIWEDYGDAKWDRDFETIQTRMISEGKVCVGWGKGGS